MRVSIYAKGGGQLKPNSPEDPWDTPRHSKFHVRENFLHMLGSFPSSAPRGVTSVVESQAVGELDISSSRKMQSVVRGKGGNRPSYPRSAAAGGLPGPPLRKRWPRRRNPHGGPQMLPWGECSLPGGRESPWHPWNQPPSPQ